MLIMTIMVEVPKSTRNIDELFEGSGCVVTHYY